MKVNRIKWIKKTNKFRKRLNEFTNAFGFSNKLLIGRIVDIIQVFKEELSDWQLELNWIESFDKGDTTMDLKSYIWWHEWEEDKDE